MKVKIYSLICSICILLALTLSLSSCLLDESNRAFDARVNEKGELIVTFPDGSQKNVGVVKGEDGVDGKDGINGKDGIDGIDGIDGKNGKDGKDGKDGVDGKDGINGADGKDGINGKDGKDGELIISGGENSISAASAKGLRSAVRIITESAEGSGVIYLLDKDAGEAFIITNYHVVYSSTGISNTINAYLYGGEANEKAMSAKYVGGSIYYDIAVLHIENSEILKQSDAIAAEIADSDKVSPGESAIAIGNAKGYGIAASSGIISVDSEYIEMTAANGYTRITIRVMRVDTAVNHGNSGGGLYDGEGKLIGIVNAKIVEDDVENMGYAIPSNVATALADNIIDYCHNSTRTSPMLAELGITLALADTKAVFDAGKTTIQETIAIDSVKAGSAAAGYLMAGDILVRAVLNEKTVEISRSHHLKDLMIDARSGDTLTLTVERYGQEISIDIPITAVSIKAS